MSQRLAALAIALSIFGTIACGSAAKPLATTPASVLREDPKPTCLVLSVGGASGVAHLGAIESLRAHGVEVSCVVGNSMGSLVGALYASNPDRDTTADFRALLDEYIAATKSDAGGRAVVGGLVGAALLGPLGLFLGGAAGATTVDPMVHERLIGVLDVHLRGVNIENLPMDYATSYGTARDEKADFVELRNGNLASAVGASVANPFIFDEIDVRDGGPIDPGMDRVSAVPVEQSCATFPHHRILAINVMAQTLFMSRDMHCPTFEIRVSVPHIEAGTVLRDPVAFAQTVAIGRDAADAWFATKEGKAFLATARRVRPEAPTTPSPSSSVAIPALYTVRVLSAALAATKPTGAPWDADGYGTADPLVTIEVTGQGVGSLRTPIAQDTLTPMWNHAAEMQLGPGDVLEVVVWDMDALFNDAVTTLRAPFDGPRRYVLNDSARSLHELVIDITPDGSR